MLKIKGVLSNIESWTFKVNAKILRVEFSEGILKDVENIRGFT